MFPTSAVDSILEARKGVFLITSNSAGVNSSLIYVKELVSPKGIKVLRLVFVPGRAFKSTGAASIKATIYSFY